jgi:hypothetical protein
MNPKETQSQDTDLALLAAVVAFVLSETADAPGQDEDAAWARSGHPHLRSRAWNPRGASAWRLQARLDAHRRTPLGQH